MTVCEAAVIKHVPCIVEITHRGSEQSKKAGLTLADCWRYTSVSISFHWVRDTEQSQLSMDEALECGRLFFPQDALHCFCVTWPQWVLILIRCRISFLHYLHCIESRRAFLR